MEVLVDQAGGIADDDGSAGLREVGDTENVFVGQAEHGGQHDGFVAGPVVGERYHVRAQPGIQEAAVPVAHVVPVVEFHAGQGFGACGPFGFRAEQDRRAGTLELSALQPGVGEGLQRLAELAYAAEDLGIGARVGQHGGVERLSARLGLPPLEKADGVGAHGHVGQGVAHELAGPFARVERLPLHG